MGAPTHNDGHPTVPADGQALGAPWQKANYGRRRDLPRCPSHSKALAIAVPVALLPRVAARTISAPTLILDQEDEEYGGRENSGQAAHEALPPSTTSHYHVFPGGHYDIYDKNYREAAAMARDWFLEHL
ncbi:MAG: hypothetical protein Ct9H300mP8_09900 [Gammaproteobacteria bacterium]|nr:MAG: hypothetical protein Ct9H300mP8_09900 [Gammaproteobacteria bacterium]